MLTKLKQNVQGLLVAEAKAAHRIGLTPNAVTVIGAILAFSAAVIYSFWRGDWRFLLIATVLLLFSGFCDALDGVVARVFGQSTVFGGFLDSLLDRYADAVVIAGLILGGLCAPEFLGWGVAALVGSLLVSYSRARAEAAGFKMESIGFAERAERLIVLVIAGLVGAFWEPVWVMTGALVLLAVLTNLTVLQRSFYVYVEAKKKVVG
jgi:archaetidylinositol phosphate synthase